MTIHRQHTNAMPGLNACGTNVFAVWSRKGTRTAVEV